MKSILNTKTLCKLCIQGKKILESLLVKQLNKDILWNTMGMFVSHGHLLCL